MARFTGVRVFLTACIAVFLAIIAYSDFNPTGLPFIPTFIDASTARVDPIEGIALPSSLKAGDLIDLPATAPEARAELYSFSGTSSPRSSADVEYELAVRRGTALIKVSVRPVDLRVESIGQQAVSWTGLYEAIVFAIVALLALWQGRDRTAWFIFLWGFVYVYGNAFDSLHVAAYGIYVMSLLAYLGYFTGRVVLYGAAESLAGDALTVTARWVLRTLLAMTVLLGVSVWLIGMWYFAHGSAAWLNQGYTWLIAVPYLVTEAALLMALQHAAGANKLRIRWLFWSLAPFVFGVFAGHVGLFGYLGGAVLNPLGIGIGGTGVLYAILRHRVVDVSVVIDKTLVYGATTTLVVGMIAAANSLALRATLGEGASLLLQVVVPLALGIVLGKVRSYMDRTVEQVFFRKKYLAEQALKDFARRCGHIDELQQLLDSALNAIRRHIRTPAVAMYEFTGKGFTRLHQTGELIYPDKIGMNDPGMVAVRADLKAIELADMDSVLGKESCVIPISVLGRLRGVLVVANRPGERFTGDEMQLLTEVVRDVGAAWRILRARDNEELVRALAKGTLKPAAAKRRAQTLEAAWAGA